VDRPDKIPVMYRTAPLSTQVVSATALLLAIALPASPSTPGETALSGPRDEPGETHEMAADSVWLAKVGFFQRRASARALVALTGDELGGQREITASLRATAGVEIYSGPRGPVLRLRRDAQSVCEPDLFLNGLRLRRRGEPLSIWFLDIVRAFEIDAIELYHGIDSPIGGPDECGALLVWSRVRADRDEIDFDAVMEGRIADSDGQPLRDCPVVVTPGDHTARTDAQGRFILFRITPGRVNVRAGSSEDGLLEDIDVRAFARTKIEIVLDACPP
jgi:hypothetical protein